MNHPLLPCTLLLGLLPACATPATDPGGQTVASAAYVGDRARADFDEIVVSLALRGSDAPCHNLHIGLTVLLNNPTRPAASMYAAPSVAQRAEPRVAARLIEVLTALGPQSIQDTPRLRDLARTEAQSVIDATMKQWTDGPSYRAEVAVTRLYWTTASVGQPPPQHPFPWRF